MFQTELLTKIGLLTVEKTIIIGLALSVIIFLVLLILGIRNTYKLKAENERLSNFNVLDTDDKNFKHSNFTSGHLYSSN
ncbi:hypothetical protein BN863_12240 [Formosa agariphila KMM 3901]|uniref:Uncharacterized protein n=1 Tax=Formosa agariphila (strain DSM 15362 / KCTC 12365 / LMG 23005 / KMM 3901 / M-2Alg 35-1) TaxID=1347342 RepID=T2KKJ1_FORAG|nr:hypothetical protein [Formosa agariphila]CDF78936.1 hypothetical protein BN863_12240 [Formosa agariphila KMM 3901]